MSSSTRRGCAAGLQWSTQTRPVASKLTRNSLCPSVANGLIRCGSKGATPPRIPIATREPGVALGRDYAARRVSRLRPVDGVAVRRCVGLAGEAPEKSDLGTVPDRGRAFHLDRAGGGTNRRRDVERLVDYPSGRGRCLDPVRVVPAYPAARPSALGCDEGQCF